MRRSSVTSLPSIGISYRRDNESVLDTYSRIDASSLHRFLNSALQVDIGSAGSEEPGGCIIGAINFKLEIRSVDDPEGRQTLRRLLRGKYQSTNLFQGSLRVLLEFRAMTR